jgi:hypothetical protein
MTAFLASNDPAAERFRTAFRDYQSHCRAGSGGEACPVCRGHCLSGTIEDVEAAVDEAQAMLGRGGTA